MYYKRHVTIHLVTCVSSLMKIYLDCDKNYLWPIVFVMKCLYKEPLLLQTACVYFFELLIHQGSDVFVNVKLENTLQFYW